jgi:hypothetical protein
MFYPVTLINPVLINVLGRQCLVAKLGNSYIFGYAMQLSSAYEMC